VAEPCQEVLTKVKTLVAVADQQAEENKSLQDK
jgi:hypothetical protein